MKTMTYMLRLLASSLLLLLVSNHINAQRRCEECGRRGMVVEFNNPSNPDYEQKRQQWRNCMTGLLGNYVSFSDDDPKVAEAAEKCSGQLPENNEYCFPEIVSAYLGEHHSNPCFHLLNPDYFSKIGGKEPEYIFKGSYEPDLEGGRIVEAVTDVFKPIIAQMTLDLYYNGTTPELVKTWFAEHTLNSPRGLLHKLNIPKNIKPIFDDFEKRPVRCDVKIPPPEEICENGTVEIELSALTDTKGSLSKSFNRIIVSIYKGEILNGDNSDFGPDWKVFTVGEGTVRIKYRPPEDKGDGWEWLRVYNSCEILPPEKSPMSGTLTDSLIIDQHFPISCGFYEGSIIVTKSWNYIKHHDNYSETLTGKQSVTYSGIFKPIPQMEGMEAQPIKMLGKGTAQGTWKHNEQRYCEGSGCGECNGLVYEEYGSGNVSSETMDGLIITTNVWPSDNKKVADQMAKFGMENWYDIASPSENVQTENRTKSYTKDGGCQWHNSSSTTNLIGADVRFKLTDIRLLKGSVPWSSSKGTTNISATNMTEAIYDQPPYDPEQNGTDFNYTITWNLKAL